MGQMNMSAAAKNEPSVRHLLAPLVDTGSVRFLRLRRDPEALAIVRAVTKSRRVTMRALLARGRGDAATALSRQLAMYLVHVLLGRSQDAVGRLFGRDASTVSHACQIIEDLRENPPLEMEIAAIETGLHLEQEAAHAA